MVIRRASQDTDQTARSLVQKAVRRGDSVVAEAAFRYLLVEKNEFSWLRSRLGVVTFEEAWPYGEFVSFGRSETEIVGHYASLARAGKNKDAAGLGSLAYALSQDDSSVLNGGEDDWYIRVVAKAIRSREQYWAWIRNESDGAPPRAKAIAQKAFEGSKKAGWPWDKAFTYAAALLAVRQPIPELQRGSPQVSTQQFPFWVAIDKHTPRGKVVLRSVAKENKLRANVVLCLSFYLESGVCLNLSPSPWWEREKDWRFGRLGLSATAAQELWGRLRLTVADRLSEDASALSHLVERYGSSDAKAKVTNTDRDLKQSSLFD